MKNSDNFVDIRNNHALLRYFMAVNRSLSRIEISNLRQKENYFVNSFVRHNFSQLNPKNKRIDPLDALHDNHCVIIHGDKGSGKSTLLNSLMIALAYYAENLTKIAIGERVPFLISVNNLPLNKIDSWDSLWQSYLDKDPLAKSLLSDPATIDQVFASGQALLLIEGVDAITDKASKEKIEHAILEGISKHPLCKSIITFQADTNSLIHKEGFPALHIKPFDNQQIKLFIKQWHQQFADTDSIPVEVLTKSLARETTSPVLLEMMCFTYSRNYRARNHLIHGGVPQNKTEVIQDIAEICLTEAIKKHPVCFDYIDLKTCLGKIALKIQDDRINDSNLFISAKDLKDLMREGLCGVENIDLAISCLSDFIVPVYQEQYSFSHIDLMEHFAAHGLKMEAELDSNFLIDRQHTTSIDSWENCWTSFFEQVKGDRLTKLYTDLLNYDSLDRSPM